MSSIADRRNVRARRSFSNLPASRVETYFWIGLALFAAAMIGCAFAGSFYANELPLDASLVSP